MKVPCFNCNERQLGCHSICPMYKAYDNERKAIQVRKAEEAEEKSYIAERAIRISRYAGKIKRGGIYD